jgi:hypothetical protein
VPRFEGQRSSSNDQPSRSDLEKSEPKSNQSVS